MDKAKAIDRAEQFLTLVRSIMDFRSAYLFGSHATGNPREDSDIDVGIFTDAMPKDYFAALRALYKARRSVDSLIEPHLFVIGQDESGFQEEVTSQGIRLV